LINISLFYIGIILKNLKTAISIRNQKTTNAKLLFFKKPDAIPRAVDIGIIKPSI
jgi:hypothetical protein